MFCSKSLQSRLNQIQIKLCLIYNELNLNLDKLAEPDKITNIHIKNVITLLSELHKTARGEYPIIFIKFSPKRKQYYNLRITNLLNFPKVIGSK